ncbi:MAG: hypothetical protein KDA93_18660 [Planctomycetaceae bacterium]|nr:hypothetical protein [Planctomycetaceae bacterium]
MRIRSVIQWTIVLLLMIAGAGGYFAQQAWERKDQLLLEGIRAELSKKAPDWEVGIEDAHIVNMQGRVKLTNFSIRPDDAKVDFLHVPECYITIDPDLLLKEHKVLVRSLHVTNPTVTLVRHEDGSWNWQKLGKPTPSDQTPEIEVEGGTFIVKVEAGVGLPETEIVSRDVALVLLPSGQKRYLIQGASQIDGAGRLVFEGKLNLNNGSWELAGKADGLDMSPSLLEKAAAISPAVQRQVAELSQQGKTLTPGADESPQLTDQDDVFQPVSQTRIIEGTPSQLSLPDLGLIANIGIDFAARSDGQQQIPDYRVLAKIMDGQVTEPLSPVPLSGLEGEILIENARVVIEKLSAANGESKLYVAGEVRKQQDQTLRVFDIEATNLWLNNEMRDLLPPQGKKYFDLVNPAGRFTVKAHYDSRAAKPLQLDQFQARDCQVRLSIYPYPVTNIHGSITQQGNDLDIELTGTAADREVKLNGLVSNLGPQAQTELDVQVDDFPVDYRISDALVLEKHQPIRLALEDLNLTGRADVKLRFLRRAGEEEKFVMGLDAHVREATLNYDRFPYPITDLSGHVHFNPWKVKSWEFRELQGRHGHATIVGRARMDLTTKPGRFSLGINAQQVPVDNELRNATLTASPVMRQVWTELNPTSGILTVEGLELNWVLGESPSVMLPSVQLEQGTITLASFPYRWDDVSADVRWHDGRVDVYRVEGYHNETHAVVEGRREGDPAYFETPSIKGSRWRLHLPDVLVTRLDPGAECRNALPAESAAVMNALDPHGPLDVRFGMDVMSFPQQAADDQVTFSSRAQIHLTNDQLFAGLQMTDVTGRVDVELSYGDEVKAVGVVDFQKARVLDMTCNDLQGPFQVLGNQVVAGSADVILAPESTTPTVPRNEQITAKLYDGLISVNAIANIDPDDSERSQYRAHVDLRNADLSQWMTEWWPDATNVTGTVNGKMNLNGQGTTPRSLRGENCWVQITDTQLGELPVMAQMLNSLVQPQVVDKTAFRYAYADFSIHDGLFDFGQLGVRVPGDTRRIQLDGTALKMVGQGYVPFAPTVDPRMQLDFYSKVDNRSNPILAIPIVNTIGRSLGDNWLHVRVTGTTNDPRVEKLPNVPLNNINDALRGFVSTLEQGLNPVFPRQVPPLPPSR